MRTKRGRMRNKSQLTIFIILAIVIAAVLLIVFYPRIKIAVSPLTPTQQIDDCVSRELTPFIEDISGRGGSANPKNTILYQDKNIEYLCYTSEYYKTCVMQQPFLKQHVEEEILDYIKPAAERCVNQLALEYEDKGYSVGKKQGNVSVEIIPHNIKVIVDIPLTITKESTIVFDKFMVVEKSEMYDLLMIAQSILNYEARYGDSSPETFMLYYPNLKIEKLKLSDGSKIYIITEKETGDKFVFASRSLSWPAGYGVDEKYVK